MAQFKGSVPPRRTWPRELVGGIVFAGLVIVIGILIGLNSRQTVTPVVTTTTITATPESYNDFVGTVAATEPGAVLVELNGTTKTGQPFSTTYRVLIDAETDLKKITTEKQERVLKPLQLNEVTIGQTLFVAGAENIAPLSEFTATKVYLYPSTS